MLTPDDIRKLEIKLYNLEKLEKDIDESIKNNHGDYEWEEAILEMEYPLSVRNEIGKRYMKKGWKYVYHLTSSENGERPGLTSFIFSEVPVKHLEDNTKYIKVSSQPYKAESEAK